MSDTDAPAALVSIFDIFNTDRASEEDGKWFLNFFGDRAPDNDVKLRSFNSKASQKVHRRMTAQHRHLVQGDGTLPTDVVEKIITQQLAEAIIADWRGSIFVNKDGSPLPYTVDNALAILKNSPYLRNRFASAGNDMDNFRMSTEADAVKN